MVGVVPDEAVLEAGIAAPIDKLGAAIKERYGGRVQRIGFYALGTVENLAPDAIQQISADLKS